MKTLETTDKPRRKDTRSRADRETQSINYNRARRITKAQGLYDEFDERIKALPPISPECMDTLARTYQHLQEMIDEATAMPVL